MGAHNSLEPQESMLLASAGTCTSYPALPTWYNLNKVFFKKIDQHIHSQTSTLGYRKRNSQPWSTRLTLLKGLLSLRFGNNFTTFVLL